MGCRIFPESKCVIISGSDKEFGPMNVVGALKD